MTNPHIFGRVYNALAQREGKRVTLPTLVTMTGLTEVQIQSAIANARRTHALHARQIEVLKLGREWRLRSSGGDESRTAESIVEEVEVGSTHIWKRVLAVLVSNAGKITSKELLAELASTPDSEITPHQAVNAMDTIMRRPEFGKHIQIKWARNAWVYNAPAASTDEGKPEPAVSTVAKTVSPSIRGSVLRYFTQKPGETLFVSDIAEDLGFTTKQVQNAVWSLINTADAVKDNFVIVQSGHSWQYRPNARPRPELNGHVTHVLEQAPARAYTPSAATTTLPVSSVVPNIPQPAPATAPTAVTSRMFEQVGELSDGQLLLRDDATPPKFYRASEM